MSAFMMWYALKELDFQRMWDELSNTNYIWVAVSVLMGFAAYMSRAIRWHMQIKPTGYSPSLKSTYHAMMVGYLANLVLPRMGEVVRCSILNRKESVPVNTGLGTVIAERFIDLTMLLLVVGIAFLVEFNRIRDFFLGLFSDKYAGLEEAVNSFYWVLVVFALVGGAILLVVFRYLSQLRKNSVFRKVVGFVKGMLKGVFSIARLENQGAFWMHTLFVWLMYYGMSLVVFFALPATSNLGWGAGLSILVVGTLGMAAPVQGGVGVYHLLVQSTLLLYGIPKEAGMAYALLVHTSQTLLVVLMGVLSFIASMLQQPVTADQSLSELNPSVHELK
jgi:glycosyltransferase 2 family protein